MAAPGGGDAPLEARPGLPQSIGTTTLVGVLAVVQRQLLWLILRGGGGVAIWLRGGWGGY